MEIEARTAADGDLEILVALYEAAEAELRPHRGGEIWSQWEGRPAPFEASLAATLADPDSRVLVGTIDDTVVGYAAVTATQLHDARTVGNLTDLFVMAGARGVGVGETMMNEITEWSAARGFVGLDSIALPGDRETKNFFETFGLVARALRVHRSL